MAYRPLRKAPRLALLEIMIIVTGVIVMGGLLLLVHKTSLGRAMRAIAGNPGVTSLMGANPIS